MGAGVLGGRGGNRRADNFSPSIPQSVTGVSGAGGSLARGNQQGLKAWEQGGGDDTLRCALG